MQLPEHFTIAALEQLLEEKITLTATDLDKVRANRNYLDNKIAGGGTYYGINTGFGSLCNVRIDDDQLKALQENLVTSHSCGFGDEVPAGGRRSRTVTVSVSSATCNVIDRCRSRAAPTVMAARNCRNPGNDALIV